MRTALYLTVLLCLLGAVHTRAQDLSAVYRIPAGTQSRVASPENPNGKKGQGGRTNQGGKGSAYATLEAGQTLTLLDYKGSGCIHRCWITLMDRSPEMLRGTRLHMYWDGQNTPAVDVLLGDFFCLNLGQDSPFENALFSTAEGRSFNCYIPMPFQKGARITLTNTTGQPQPMVFYDIDYTTTSQAGPKTLYFHARWLHQDHRPIPEDIDLLPKITGKGRFLGVSVGLVADPTYAGTWWGEGEVKMYLDGDTAYPTITGTGTEDYLGSGWLLGKFTNRYQGCLQADQQQGRYSFYRFHIPDPIWFAHDLHVTLQQLGGGSAATVKALQAKGVRLRPVNITRAPRFTGLLDSKDPKAYLAGAADRDWICFNRSDDYAVTAYYYLNKP